MKAFPPNLSAREIEVLQLLAKGENQSSIAQILFISEEASRARVKKLREKLNAATVAEAVYLAMRRRILE